MVRDDGIPQLREAMFSRKGGAPDPDIVALDDRVNALAGQGLEGRRLRERKALGHREIDDGSRKRMLRSRFGAREDPDHLVLANTRTVHVIDDLRPASGERARLVERDNVDRAR